MNTPYGFKYQFNLVASAIIRTKLLFGALFLQGYFLFVGCSSPLNEIEVEDFNLIRAFVSVVKEISSDGAVKDLIQLQITDKNWRGFELQNAVVTMNGSPMEYKNKPFLNAYFSDAEILPSTKYEFIVVIPNGQKAILTITTPAIDINSIEYNKTISLGEDYSIAWDQIDIPFILRFLLTDNLSEDSTSRYDVRHTSTTNEGKVIIHGDKTENLINISQCYFDLTFSGNYSLSDKFRSSIAIVEFIYNAEDVKVDN